MATAAAALLGFMPESLPDEEPADGSSELLAEPSNYRHKIVYETNRDGNWGFT